MSAQMPAEPPPAAAGTTRNNHCFACGQDNPNGLHLRFAALSDGRQHAVWLTEKKWEGFDGVIHGGIVSTVLDEAMAKAVAAAGMLALTCELRIRLRQHVPPAEELSVTAWIVERRRRRIATEASLVDRHGNERAHAWGTFLETAKPGSSQP
jgi:acyl-coenzyme A thioesterase PaaI-like protein